MLGNILLTLGLLAGVFTMVMYYLSIKGYENTKNLARIGYHVLTISVVIASAILLHAILTHQYEYAYVYKYSGSNLPTGLLMSTFYAGQEGSFMLWLLFTSIIGLILLEYSSKRGDLEQRVMLVYTLAATFLLVMVNPLLKSPFTYIWADPNYIDIKNLNQSFLNLPFIQNFMFSNPNTDQQLVQVNSDLYGLLAGQGISMNEFIIQGKGLNPLLQNFWMQIHPPILFIGFSMATVPFAFALAALIKNEYTEWVKQSLPWIVSGMMLLGLGIMLGGYWAYGVLGWGGYWGWDPVENASLVPWLVGVALIHTLLVQRRTQKKNGGSGRFVRTNLILAVLTYVLVLYSTFLTRSGILGDSSVHSFVSPGMLVYFFLVMFIGTFIVLGFGGIIYRWKYLDSNFAFEENVLSRELALFTGAVALIASAVIVAAGTSAPIFGQSVEIRFYNELNLPIAIIIGLLNGLSLMLKWKYTNGKNMFQKSKFSIAATIVSTALIIFIGEVYDLMLALLTFSSAFALFVNLEIAYKIIKGRLTHLGAYVAHVGIALFLLGVIATGGFSKEESVDLAKGETVETLNHKLTFMGYTPIENGSKYAFNIKVEKGNSSSVVSPVMYVSDFNNSLMREPDILTKLTRDFYVAPVGYNDGRNSGNGNQVTLTKGDTYEKNGAVIKFLNFNFPEEGMSSMMSGGEFQIGAALEVNYKGETKILEPVMKSSGGERTFIPVKYEPANLKIDMNNLDASGKVSLFVSNLDGNSGGHNHDHAASNEVLSINASIQPFINLVWLGVFVMCVGFVLSAVRRTKESHA
jgi:cytochrome c-type biogenesis protein CcmF